MDGKGRTVRELLAGRKYSIDYYQREYKWQGKQLVELIDDRAFAMKVQRMRDAEIEMRTLSDAYRGQ